VLLYGIGDSDGEVRHIGVDGFIVALIFLPETKDRDITHIA
jgi:hypothetical protein